MCRILKSKGHRIILADMEKFKLSASRFSNCVDSWVTLPNVTADTESVLAYKDSIRKLIMAENVDWWIPVSHTNTAVIETSVAEELDHDQASVKVLSIDSVDTANMLDDKISFLEDARSMGLPVPDFYQISSCQDVVDLQRKGR